MPKDFVKGKIPQKENSLKGTYKNVAVWSYVEWEENSMKIAFYALRDFDELPFVKKFSDMYGIDYVWTPEYPSSENIKLAEGCDGVSTVPCAMPEKWVEEWHNMGITAILCRSIGFDHVPLQKTRDLGMVVANTPYPTNCVADYAVMLILMCLRQMKQIMIRAEAQDFTLKNKMGRTLGDLTVGVIGTGRIGRVLLRHLSGFGCRLLAYDRNRNEEAAAYADYVSLDALYKEADVISLHLPSNADTFHMINEESLAKMKDGVVIINTARGNLIDSAAFIEAIKKGKVGAAGLDLLENENGLYYHNRSGEVIANDELAMLRSFPNVIVSPHMAFYVEQTISCMVEENFITMDHLRSGKESPYRIK